MIRGKKGPRPFLLALAALLLTDPLAHAQETAAADDDGSGRREVATTVEEIVVQARRRDEFLEDTPVAVTALGASQLTASGVNRVDDIQQLVPNLTFESAISGQQTNIRIRGVGTSAPAIAFDPGVGVYVDGVFVPRSFGMLMDVMDVQQIEVLRGPQGTLFGKNTVGGAINVRTVKPHEELEGSVMVRAGNFDSVDTRAMLNFPILEERLFARFSFSSRNSGGYFRNTLDDSRLSDVNNLAINGSLRLLVTDDITVDVNGTWSRAHSRARGGQCRVVNENASLATLVPEGFYDSCRRSTPFSGEPGTNQLGDVESYGLWAITNWAIGDLGPLENLNIRLLGSWREQNPRLRTDVDGTQFLGVQNSSTGGSGVADGAVGEQRQFNPELLVTGEALDGMLSYTLGAFGFWEEGLDGRTLSVLPNSLDRVTFAEINIDNWTWAVFGQATADVTDWLSVTGGVRYTQDKKGLFFIQTDPRTGAQIDNTLSGREVFDAWTPMASVAVTVPEEFLDATPVEHVMTYFTYSRGFKGGGFNGVSQPRNVDASQFAFDPETLDNFELGLKTIAFEGAFTANVALFYGKYDEIQRTSIRDLGLDEEGLPLIQRLTINAAEATTKGIEIETLTRPFPGMQITANVGYTDAEYDSFMGLSDLDGQEIDRAGQSFEAVPKFQTLLALQYTHHLGDGLEPLDGSITPRVEWAYQSKINWSGPEVAAARQSGWNRLNARLTYSFYEDRAQIALWAKNLLDEAYFNNVTPIASTFGVLTALHDPPRTYGVELSYRF